MADEVVEKTVDQEAVSETAEAPTEESSEPTTIADDLTLGSGAPADQDAEPMTASIIRGKIDKFGVAMGTGRRKTSVARVRIKDGNGEFTINGRLLADYFQLERDQQAVQAPLEATQTAGTVDVWIRVNGGGTTGQTGAVVLGIARALQAKDPGLHHLLAAGGYLTRDSRMVERKKYGLKKARKSFQFSKR